MRTISFKKNCRSCLQTNGLDNFYNEVGEELDFYKNLTDYEISKRINVFLSKEGINCEFCNSNNFDINEIKVDNYLIFDYDRFHNYDFDYIKKGTEHFLIDLTKRDRNIKKSLGASDNRSIELFKTFKDIAINHLNSLPDSNFIDNKDGKFHICITRNINVIKIEKLRYYGFSKNGAKKFITMIFDKCIENENL